MTRSTLATLLAALGCGLACLTATQLPHSSQSPTPAPSQAKATPRATPRATSTPKPEPIRRDTRSKQQILNDGLSMAAWGGDKREVLRLLRAGAHINGLSSSGYRPLCQAVAINSHAGHSASYPNSQNPHSADMAKFLLAHGADPDLANRSYWEVSPPGVPSTTPLELALGAAHECSPQVAIVRALLQGGANPNARFSYAGESAKSESTPLGSAAIWGDKSIMRMLLAFGARVNGRDGRGRTALMHAARSVEIWNSDHSSEEAMRLLIRRGARIEARDDKGWRALFYAVAEENHDYEGDYELLGNANFAGIKLLLRHGARVNVRDKRGRTPLMYAALYRVDPVYSETETRILRQDAVVRLLLRSGADASARDLNGRTARDLAQRAKNQHVVRALDMHKPQR